MAYKMKRKRRNIFKKEKLKFELLQIGKKQFLVNEYGEAIKVKPFKSVELPPITSDTKVIGEGEVKHYKKFWTKIAQPQWV